MTPEHEEEFKRWATQDDELKEKIRKGLISNDEGAKKQAELDEWYDEFMLRAVSREARYDRPAQ